MDTLSRIKLIVNPNANLGKARHTAFNLRPLIAAIGNVTWSETEKPGDATELARQAVQDGYDLVIAAGGDGTVHEVVNGLMQFPAEQRPVLGVLPLGSGNDFSHAIGIDAHPEIALKQMFASQPFRIDVGRMVDEAGTVDYWVNALGVGFDTTVTIRSHRLKVIKGFMIYLVAVLQTIILNHDAPRMKVTTDLESWEHESLMLVLCNGGREGGAFNVSPRARPDDGVFQYAGIQKVSRLMMLRLLPEVMKGTHERFPQVHSGQFRELTLQADRPLYIHTDGEVFSGFGSDVRQFSVTLLPGELEVLGAKIPSDAA